MVRFLVVAALIVPCLAQSSDSSYVGIPSLKGIEAVSIEIIGLKESDSQYGMRKEAIAAEVAAFLLENNIVPVDADKIHEVPGQPKVRLAFNIHVDPKQDVAAVFIELSLMQQVALNRDKEIVIKEASTWYNNSLALMPPQAIRQMSQVKVKDFLIQFFTDHSTANGNPLPLNTDQKEGAV